MWNIVWLAIDTPPDLLERSSHCRLRMPTFEYSPASRGDGSTFFLVIILGHLVEWRVPTLHFYWGRKDILCLFDQDLRVSSSRLRSQFPQKACTHMLSVNQKQEIWPVTPNLLQDFGTTLRSLRPSESNWWRYKTICAADLRNKLGRRSWS